MIDLKVEIAARDLISLPGDEHEKAYYRLINQDERVPPWLEKRGIQLMRKGGRVFAARHQDQPLTIQACAKAYGISERRLKRRLREIQDGERCRG